MILQHYNLPRRLMNFSIQYILNLILLELIDIFLFRLFDCLSQSKEKKSYRLACTNKIEKITIQKLFYLILFDIEIFP